MEERCGIINNETHTCDVEKTEIVLGNSGSFELDKKGKELCSTVIHILSLSLILCERHERKSIIQLMMLGGMESAHSFLTKMLWSIKSNAFL